MPAKPQGKWTAVPYSSGGDMERRRLAGRMPVHKTMTAKPHKYQAEQGEQQKTS